MGLIHTNDFYNTLSKKHQVFDCYSKLRLAHNNQEVYSAGNENNHKTSKNVRTVDLFPSYLTPVFKNGEQVNVKVIPQNKITGYAIKINDNKGFDDFFNNEFSKSFRSNTRRFVNRFEACFNASYNMFFGHIEKPEYNALMDALHTMLTKRFNQRDQSNKMLKNWGFFLATTFQNINSKKASLFVVYHDNVPVQISLNYHFNGILFVAVPSYNIDYARFSLGNISIYKLLEWAVTHKYAIMDLEYGYLEYKRRWSNYIYPFSHHVVYAKNNVGATFFGTVQILKLKLKNILKAMKVDELSEKLKSNFNKQKSTFEAIEYKTESINFGNPNNLDTLNIASPQLSNHKKIIFDFLFVNKEFIGDLKIYELTPFKEYVLSGKTVSEKITVI